MRIRLKECTKCGKFKETCKTFFHKNSRTKDGFRSECKLCRKEK